MVRVLRPSHNTQMVRAWWIRWMVFQAGPFICYHYIGGSVSSIARPADSLLWLACLVPLAMTSILRWLFLPATGGREAVEIVFSLGVGLSAATCLFGLFLF